MIQLQKIPLKKLSDIIKHRRLKDSEVYMYMSPFKFELGENFLEENAPAHSSGTPTWSNADVGDLLLCNVRVRIAVSDLLSLFLSFRSWRNFSLSGDGQL